MKDIIKTAALLIVSAAGAVFFSELKKPAVKETPEREQIISQSGEAVYRCLGGADFCVLNEETGEVTAMTEDEYVIRAVLARMPADYPEEALKAQAEVLRTYAVRRREEQLSHPSEELKGAYISDDTEKYQSFLTDEQLTELYGTDSDEAYDRVSEAVKSVSGEVIIYNGEPIAAVFHPVSGGRTESSENIWGTKADYLVPVDSSFDKKAPDYLTKRNFTADEVWGRLNAEYSDSEFGGELSDITVSSATDSGTVMTVAVGDKSIPGADFGRIFSLPSQVFELTSSEGVLSVICKGRGHGVGMSIYGAKVLAEQGLSHEEIISYYYTGAETVLLEYSD